MSKPLIEDALAIYSSEIQITYHVIAVLLAQKIMVDPCMEIGGTHDFFGEVKPSINR